MSTVGKFHSLLRVLTAVRGKFSGDNQAWLGSSEGQTEVKTHTQRKLLKIVWGMQHINKSEHWLSHWTTVYWVNKHRFGQAFRLVKPTGPVGEEEVVVHSGLNTWTNTDYSTNSWMENWLQMGQQNVKKPINKSFLSIVTFVKGSTVKF